MNDMKYLSFACAGFLGLSASNVSADDFADVIKRYGKPDRVTSSEKERPRPPIVTKFAEYKKEGVRFVFVPDAPVNTPPPYKGWKLIAPQDIAGGKDGGKLSDNQVTERMAKRQKK
jgi:hypothetical protein